jgi:hypothetical protein
MGRWPRTFLTVSVLLAIPVGPTWSAEVQDRERRCLTMIAYAEAGGEGSAGMLAVMKVVRNRITNPGFADDACAVALEPGQFQPVGERPALRRALAVPFELNMAEVLQANSPEARSRLVEAWRLAGAAPGWPARDPTGGALYFVNPELMDPGKCPWFAGLKRTAVVGRHVFMTHYADGEPRIGPALDCRMAGKSYRNGLGVASATGPFARGGPRIATRAATPAMLKAWRRTGELAARQAELKSHFKPGWFARN